MATILIMGASQGIAEAVKEGLAAGRTGGLAAGRTVRALARTRTAFRSIIHKL
jgi:hypothetical protein